MRIPPLLHFVWFGPELPDFAKVAVRSALKLNPQSEAILWHDVDFGSSPELRSLKNKGLQVRRIDIESLLNAAWRLDPSLDISRLRLIYRSLDAPASRANVVRMLVLYLYGGVYLDTDTLSVRDLSPLRAHSAFCGTERILWPAGKSRGDLGALALAEARRFCAAIPRGYRLHRKFSPLYSTAANNAVMGAAPQHPLISGMLHRASRLPSGEWKRRFRLGTHLLQEALRDSPEVPVSEDEKVELLSPEHFYPVGPMISRHYFKNYPDPEKVASELLGPKTYVVHWYASVANLRSLNYDHIRRSATRSVYSHLCRDFTPELPLVSSPPVPTGPIWVASI